MNEWIHEIVDPILNSMLLTFWFAGVATEIWNLLLEIYYHLIPFLSGNSDFHLTYLTI